MTKMRAAVLKTSSGNLEIIDGIDIPPLTAYQVLVKISHTGVCRSQLMEIDGLRGPDPWLPHMLGHEAVGEVEAIGSNVKKLSVGDRVIATWIRADGGECNGCKYDYNGLTINAGSVTTFSNYSVISENRLVKINSSIPSHLAVTLGCAVPTGAGIVFNQLRDVSKKTLAIFGLGGIGLSALLAAKTKDFSKIIVVDIDDEKLELARQIGVHLSINPTHKDPVKKIRNITSGGVDFSIDASGICSVIEKAFVATTPKTGITYFASHPPAGEFLKIDPHDLIRGRQIFGSWGGGI
ncbi:alcohol dehydrogenase catalytic domain-containing protein [Planktomarina temperata]|nr:alcohol dehydrogenase catalytic domain-containing protein [Planktomarina temperata]